MNVDEKLTAIEKATDAILQSFEANLKSAPDGEAVMQMATTRAARELILLRGELTALRTIAEETMRSKL